jgi:hypothetical protein
MANTPPPQIIPADDALCEACGYPLKGLSADAVCPECGLAVVESSPARRTLYIDDPTSLRCHAVLLFRVMTKPASVFRTLAIKRSVRAVLLRLMCCAALAAACWTAVAWAGGKWRATVRWQGYAIEDLALMFVGVFAAVCVLTCIEASGVTAFSRRRGWRIPFSLALQVCSLASIAWVPGAIIASIGFEWLQEYGAGRPWFEQLVGLVRVGWLIYGVIFVVALVGFETLVWIGVRQVRFANAWPTAQQRSADKRGDPAAVDATRV